MTLEELDIIIEKEGDDFSFEYRHIKCIGTRHPDFGHWCGYVVIPSDFGCDVDDSEISVHGGITWIGKYGEDENNEIMMGFDAAHARDLNRIMLDGTHSLYNNGLVYRDIDYIKSECRSMVDQIHELYPYFMRKINIDKL